MTDKQDIKATTSIQMKSLFPLLLLNKSCIPTVKRTFDCQSNGEGLFMNMPRKNVVNSAYRNFKMSWEVKSVVRES